MRLQILAGVVALFICNQAWAVYRCVDGNGKVSYQDFTCQEGKQGAVELAKNSVDMNLQKETQRTVAGWKRDAATDGNQRQQERATAGARLNNAATTAAMKEKFENDARIERAKNARAGQSLYPQGLRNSDRQ